MDSVPSVISGRFEPYRLLGEGSFGQTFAARDRRTGTDVALKILHIRRLNDWKALELFEREATILQSLDHRRIPDYVEYQCDDGEGPIYLAQELAPGRSIGDLLAEGKQFGEEECIQVARQVLEVLAYLEERRPPVVHRDIKPDNLLWDDGSIYVVDFGAVREVVRASKVGSTVAGTFGYMAPEQVQGQAVPASDIYGLAMTLIHMLTGVAPVELPRRRMRPVYDEFADPSPALAHVIDQMTEPVVEDRIQSARKCLEIFEQVHGVDRVASVSGGREGKIQRALAKRERREAKRQRAEALEKNRVLQAREDAGDHLTITARGGGRWTIEFSPPEKRLFIDAQDFPYDAELHNPFTTFLKYPSAVVLVVVAAWCVYTILTVEPDHAVEVAAVAGILYSYVGLTIFVKRKLLMRRLRCKILIEDGKFMIEQGRRELVGELAHLSVDRNARPRRAFDTFRLAANRRSVELKLITPAEAEKLERHFQRIGVFPR